jgi:hypothetical protein
VPTTPFDVALTTQLRVLQLPETGTTAERPVVQLFIGQMFFDVTLGVPVWWQGGHWVDASGAAT